MINSPTAPAVTDSAGPLAHFQQLTSSTLGAVKVLTFDMRGFSPFFDVILTDMSTGRRAIVPNLFTRDTQHLLSKVSPIGAEETDFLFAA